jgi:hypothetical protein
MEQATQLFVWGAFIHLVADWLLQTEWMTRHKGNLCHPAGWVHGGVHAGLLMIVFPWSVAAIVGIVHVLIDTRVPLAWWLRHYKRLSDGPHRLTVEIWVDQVLHLSVIAVAAIAIAHLGQ